MDRQGYTSFSSEQNGNRLYEMHEDDIIFSANQSDSSMEDEYLQAKETEEAYGEIEHSEEVVCSTGFTADFQRKEVHQDNARDSENTDKEDDPPVYPSCPLRLSESILLIMTLAIRHNLTGDALADVIKLVDLHCVPGPNSHSVKTWRELKSYITLRTPKKPWACFTTVNAVIVCFLRNTLQFVPYVVQTWAYPQQRATSWSCQLNINYPSFFHVSNKSKSVFFFSLKYRLKQ